MLALYGGAPIRESYLPYGQQWLDETDINSVIETLKSDFITQGPKIAEFESKVAAYAGTRYAVAFSSGTAALHGACFAAGIREGDEVITTPVTFVASANCALYMGAKPVFVDIDRHTYNLDPALIEGKISSKTKAIVAVDFTGQPADMNPIKEIAARRGLVLIEDAAHSLGATYDGIKVGQLADMTMFSFHPVKTVASGEGGMIVTDSEQYARQLRLFRSHGITKDNLSIDEGPWYYEMIELGHNFRITDIQAALGASQMNKIDRFVSRRREIASIYNEYFLELNTVTVPYQMPQTESAWHLYILRLRENLLRTDRRVIFDALRAENIGVHVHYIPVHLQPYYQKLGYSKGLCPIAEQWYEEVITLPLFPKMSDEDVRSVCFAVKKVLKYFEK